MNTKNCKLESILFGLGMEHAKFKITLELEDKFLHNGKDKLNFLFTANKGGNFNSLKKAASGGEWSRIILAIKSILANYINLPTIMFDEIDSGVSGEIANKMSAIMKHMSKNMQVFSITHSPQIAVKADVHYFVYKKVNDDRTTTKVKLLTPDERVRAVATMLSGNPPTSSAMENAGNVSGQTFFMGTAEATNGNASGKVCVIDRGVVSFFDKIKYVLLYL